MMYNTKLAMGHQAMIHREARSVAHAVSALCRLIRRAELGAAGLILARNLIANSRSQSIYEEAC